GAAAPVVTVRRRDRERLRVARDPAARHDIVRILAGVRRGLAAGQPRRRDERGDADRRSDDRELRRRASAAGVADRGPLRCGEKRRSDGGGPRPRGRRRAVIRIAAIVALAAACGDNAKLAAADAGAGDAPPTIGEVTVTTYVHCCDLAVGTLQG